MKSYVAYRITPLAVTLKVTCCLKHFSFTYHDTFGNTECIIYYMFTYETMNRKAHMAGNFNCLFENKGLVEVTDSHIHYKCGSI